MEVIKTNKELFFVLTDEAEKSELPFYNPIFKNLVLNLN